MTLKIFLRSIKKCTEKPYSFLVNDTTLASYIPLRFRKGERRGRRGVIFWLEKMIRNMGIIRIKIESKF